MNAPRKGSRRVYTPARSAGAAFAAPTLNSTGVSWLSAATSAPPATTRDVSSARGEVARGRHREQRVRDGSAVPRSRRRRA